jgi:hypothetical protein
MFQSCDVELGLKDKLTAQSLDTAFAELTEQLDFDLPANLAVERAQLGMVEIACATCVLTALGLLTLLMIRIVRMQW